MTKFKLDIHKSYLDRGDWKISNWPCSPLLENQAGGKDQTIRGLVAQNFLMDHNQATLKEAIIALLFSLEVDFKQQLALLSDRQSQK